MLGLLFLAGRLLVDEERAIHQSHSSAQAD